MQDPSCCILYNTARTESCGLWAPITAAAARFAPQTRPLPPARERTPRPARSSASIMCPQNPPHVHLPRHVHLRAAPRVTHAPAGESGPPGRARFSGSGESPQTSQTVWPSESGEAHSTSTRSSSTSNSSGLARGTRRAARARASARSGLAGGGGQQRGGRAGTRAPPRRHRGHGAAGLACGTRGGRCP